MLIVTHKKTGLKLKVLGYDADRGSFIVCKETAPNPMMARFLIKVEATSASDYLQFCDTVQ